MSSNNRSLDQTLLTGLAVAANVNALRGPSSTITDLNARSRDDSAASGPNDKGRGSSRPYSSHMKE